MAKHSRTNKRLYSYIESMVWLTIDLIGMMERDSSYRTLIAIIIYFGWLCIRSLQET
ncbi:MAG: hypothetical protein QXY33_06370 [Candidatus Nitrosocaldaceae archaeon]